jgi:flagellar motor component MotA
VISLQSQAVDMLKETMEQYANYGFHAIEEKMKDSPNHFYKNTGFLDMLVQPSKIDDEIEEL